MHRSMASAIEQHQQASILNLALITNWYIKGRLLSRTRFFSLGQDTRPVYDTTLGKLIRASQYQVLLLVLRIHTWD